MKYAIISDIHSDATALRAVLADATDAGCSKIVCLGDVVGYGPEPVETLELVYRRVHVCLAGNHDDAVCGRRSFDDFNDFAAAAVRRQIPLLKSDAVDWLRHLPYVCEFPGFACTHGAFVIPEEFDYVISESEAMESFNARPEPLLFVGHTHRPCVYALSPAGAVERRDAVSFTAEVGWRYLVNVGSVGYPRSGDCRSVYCVWDGDTGRVEFRTLPFDLEGYAARMHRLGLDEAPWMVERSQERAAADVRGREDFAAAPKTKRGDGGRKVHVTPVAVPVASAVAMPGERRNYAPAMILAAVIVAASGVWCTFKMLRSGPTAREIEAVSKIKVASAAVGPAVVHESASNFVDSIPLSGEWVAYRTSPADQRVKVDGNSRFGTTSFRIHHAKEAVMRFEKRLELFDRPPKLYTVVSLLTPALPGKRLDFSFSACMRFVSASGETIGERHWDGRRSAKRALEVPPEAAAAVLDVDCRCNGDFEIAEPYFRREPARRHERGRGR